MRCYLSAVMLKNLNAKTIPPFQQYRHRTYDESLVLHVSIHVIIPTLTFCVLFWLCLHKSRPIILPLASQGHKFILHQINHHLGAYPTNSFGGVGISCPTSRHRCRQCSCRLTYSLLAGCYWITTSSPSQTTSLMKHISRQFGVRFGTETETCSQP